MVGGVDLAGIDFLTSKLKGFRDIFGLSSFVTAEDLGKEECLDFDSPFLSPSLSFFNLELPLFFFSEICINIPSSSELELASSPSLEEGFIVKPAFSEDAGLVISSSCIL